MGDPRPDCTIHEAIDYIINESRVGHMAFGGDDSSDGHKLDYAVRLLSEAAREGRIVIWGKPDATNELRVIEPEEWQVRQVDHFCHTSPYDVPEYTARNMFQFYDLQVQKKELESVWPGPGRWRRLLGLR